VTYRMADLVTSSWPDEDSMPVPPRSMVEAWEVLLQRAAVEGITVNFASGDAGNNYPGPPYPDSDPWVTSVGGTSLAIGQHGNYLWETPWETD
jgi:subtilase family serine protease